MEKRYNNEAIAVIGMTGRFPGAKDIDTFWDNLKKGVESVSVFSEEELLLPGSDDIPGDATGASGKTSKKRYINADAVLEDIDKFDAEFFGISPREAEIMDPQHRMFLEACWEVMELAGYTSDKYSGTIAVYAGANLSSYMIRNLYSNPGLVESIGTFKTMLTNGQDFLSTRVSYLMNLKGPSINVNTLCSSSLVAVHLACQSLIDYHCDLALAGGVNVQVSKNEALFYQEGGIGASDGHCRAFDAAANGTVSGSGLGVIVLKRMEEAVKDGDNILAVIRGSAVNNDGSSKNSYTAPNPDGQAECIADAIAMSEVDPETITLIEAHGTGTNLGDPIEIAGLTKAFRVYTDKIQYCAIGSVKTNIGHLVTAGGIASLIKVILSMKHKLKPASLNFSKPNPNIDFECTPFFVNTEPTEWERTGDIPRRAGVSSFGIGGTNAHVIVEEAPAPPDFMHQDTGKSRSLNIITLSAKTEKALDLMSGNILKFATENRNLNPADIAFTQNIGRKNFDIRRFAVFKGIEDFENSLKSCAITYTEKQMLKPAVFLMPPDMNISACTCKALYNEEEIFKKAMDECAGIFSSKYGFDLLDSLLADDQKSYRQSLAETEPCSMAAALFTVCCSTAKLWITLGVNPESIAASGPGLLVAGYLAGMMSLQEAISMIFSEDMQVSLRDPSIGIIPLISDSGEGTVGNNDFRNRIAEMEHQKIETLLENTDRVYLQIGPPGHRVEKLNADGKLKILSPFNKGRGNEYREFLIALGHYWSWSGRIDWEKFYKDEQRKRIALPTYPFERKSYWIKPGGGMEGGGKVGKAEEGKKAEVSVQPKLTKRPRPEIETPYIKYRSETEKILAEKWEEVLGIEEVGINDDFFELGGHSLLAASIASSLSDRFGMQLELTELMEYSTIASLAEIIDTYRWMAQGDRKEETAATGSDREEGTL